MILYNMPSFFDGVFKVMEHYLKDKIRKKVSSLFKCSFLVFLYFNKYALLFTLANDLEWKLSSSVR